MALLFGQQSQQRLNGVDPRLVEVLNLTRQRTGIPFEVTEGMRDAARQKQLVAAGKSQTMNSRHLHGNATDIHIKNPDGSVNWDFEAYRPIADEAKKVAAELGYNDFVWGGDWKSLKDGVHFQIGGNTPQSVAADTMTALGQPPRQENEQMNLLGLSTQGQFRADPPQQKEPWWNADRRDRLVMGLEGMTLNPNQGLMAAAQAGMQERAQGRKDDKKEQRDAERRNKTAQWLAGRPGGEMFGNAIGAGGDPQAVLNAYLRTAQASGDPSVQTSSMLPDQSGTVITMRDGSVKVMTVGGETLAGQEAIDYARQAQEKAADLERGIYQARREGTNTGEILTGAEAAGAGAAGTQAIKMAGDSWTAYGQLNTSIANIDEAIRALDSGAKAGAIDRFLPNITEASASLQNAMDRMGLDVIGAVTFGALSQGEMRLAMETAVPRNLDEPELRSWLARRRDAQEKAATMIADAAQFLSRPGNTLNDWINKNKSSGQGGGASSGGAVRKRYNPNTQQLEVVK